MMNARTFDGDTHSISCPVCKRTTDLQPREMILGLFTCPHCRSRLVISWSGNYVRDPFTLKNVAVGQMLRRQSRPFARILRDFSVARRSYTVLIVTSAAIALSFAFVALQTGETQRPSPPAMVGSRD
ncbi:MAG: hypothetical protein HC925_07150 [Coleofasciculaceae cyanobacterium SM2_3_26]|nr:hypothetical protein [Coleofasciculaceae cyanobacterium SM2_3_26]